MASVLETRKVHRRDVNRFVLTQAYRLKDHARQMAAREGRPYQYFGKRTRKEDLARQLAERDGIEEGLVCVVATVEPCRTCSLRWREGAAFIQSARRKCLILYDSFMDREFGLIHVRLQTWFPLQLQVSVNGHEWLARKLAHHGVRYTKHDNPVARPDSQLFVALMSGEHAVHGFANRDLRATLTGHLRDDPKQQSAQISRLLHRLHVYGLVAKIPRSRRWRVTAFGHRVMGASVRLRQLHVPAFYAEAA
ncbi:MAG TPA: hypothetical protein DCQ64_25180 [Candidatus Rokubacteria bacterium]|nr:hypothetical protein [Candidatus Rokubacteria bacterium]